MAFVNCALEKAKRPEGIPALEMEDANEKAYMAGSLRQRHYEKLNTLMPALDCIEQMDLYCNCQVVIHGVQVQIRPNLKAFPQKNPFISLKNISDFIFNRLV